MSAGAAAPVERRVTVVNPRGFHARPAAKFARLAQGFDAAVRVTAGGETVSGSSIMGLMMFAAAQGTELVISADGREAAEAVAALADLVARGFDDM